MFGSSECTDVPDWGDHWHPNWHRTVQDDWKKAVNSCCCKRGKQQKSDPRDTGQEWRHGHFRFSNPPPGPIPSTSTNQMRPRLQPWLHLLPSPWHA
jgi:hypothetical protein